MTIDWQTDHLYSGIGLTIVLKNIFLELGIIEI